MSESNQPIIEIRDLSHTYKRHQALQGVSFSVGSGSIHGFVGPNGAGKTTTLKILATLLKPQRGSVRVFGLDIVNDYKNVRRKIGFMPDHFSLYRQMTVQEYLDFFAAAYGMDMGERNRVVGDVLALTDMAARRSDLIKGLSRGMQQRISLARVLVHDPTLLLLDEPASGLDPRARIELMEIIQELRRMGKTIFISSHILSELALLCDSVTILDRGSVRYSGSMAGLSHSTGETVDYLLSLVAEHPDTEGALRKVDGVVAVTKAAKAPQYRVSFQRKQTDPNTLLRATLDSGAQILGFQEIVRQLNQAFMDLTEPGVPPVIQITDQEQPPLVVPPGEPS
ncbi:MAG TPA: ABC transporter ATP-binding protein [Verrucomicrobiae bacterium]|jgi:ABC-2 type transport system ATP-binding protein|nr:ABC transporter ATP-binding protein [Verrucomicrobiae bacterium]